MKFFSSDRSRRSLVLFALLSPLWVGCGNGANFNKIWGSDEESLDSLMLRARMAYDQGKYEKAQELGEKVLALNQDNEEAAVLLGYTAMSQGGIDPFTLANNLMNLNSGATALTASSGSGFSFDDLEYELSHFDLTTTAAAPAATGATGALSSLNTAMSKLFGLTDADYTTNLGASFSDSADGAALFKDYPLVTPNEVTDELREKVAVLKYMNKAIKYTCRFVDSAVKQPVEQDPRDTSAACATSTQPHNNSNKAHFLWAFTHLTEAIVYQGVLLYGKGGTPNINQRVTVVQAQKFGVEAGADAASSITKFVAIVTDLKSAVDSIFAVTPRATGAVTQLTAVLSGLNSVTAGFGQLAGMPASITSSIKTATADLLAAGKKLGAATDSLGQAQALRGQMVTTVSATVVSKIDSAVCDDVKVQCDTVDAEKKTQLCNSYDTLSTGIAATAKTKPKLCE